MIRRRRRNNAMGTRKIDDAEAQRRHARWVRGFECLNQSPFCSDRVEAHHVREGSGAGKGQKPHNERCVPLCATCHAEGHRTGWKTFERLYELDLRAEAEKLAKQSPHLWKAGK